MLKIEEEELEKNIMQCFEQLHSAAQSKIDTELAEKAAAFCLTIQMRLASFLEDIELRSRQAKNNISLVYAETYYKYKEENNGKKMTEVSLEQLVNKDENVLNANNEFAKQEATLKKYMYILNAIKDAHLFYRSIMNTGRYI